MKKSIKSTIEKAKSGDKKALELVVLEVKDLIYNLSLKMLLFPADAQDVTQDILIKVITRLSTFNHLLTYKGKRASEFAMPLEEYADLIDRGQSHHVKHAANDGELSLLEEEVKVSCTQGLLLCLNTSDRMVYILSEILEFNGNEGAEIMGLAPQNFRKKLSRSRIKV